MPVILFEFALFTLVLVVGVTQVLWPIWRGTPLFPLFTKEGRLLREAERERQRQIEMRINRDLTRETLREADVLEETHEQIRHKQSQ